jgi:pimeloyl-ACP methyl ester carboxylesterase
MRVIGGSGPRSVTVDCWGNPDGRPAILLHGTPGGGTVPCPSVLYRLGIGFICYDRPGYGCSDRHTGCTVAGAAWDVLADA